MRQDDRRSTSAKRTYGPQSIGSLIGGSIDEVARKRGFVRSEILSLWPELVGPEIAPGSLPGEISWPKRRRYGAESGREAQDGTLLVYADGPTALLITHDTPRILERVNRVFGYPALAHVRVSQKASAAPRPRRQSLPIITLEDELAINRRLKGIEDEELRSALERLGRNVAASNKGRR